MTEIPEMPLNLPASIAYRRPLVGVATSDLTSSLPGLRDEVAPSRQDQSASAARSSLVAGAKS
jgi:hypothetical protein